VNIYVGNLPYKITDTDMRELFAAYGEVSSVSMVKDKMTGQSKGFGFVEMPNDAEAAAASHLEVAASASASHVDRAPLKADCAFFFFISPAAASHRL
jgi:hypothetical protein